VIWQTHQRRPNFGRTRQTYQHSPGNVALFLTTVHGSNYSGYGSAVVTINHKGAGAVREDDIVWDRSVLLEVPRSATVTAQLHDYIRHLAPSA